MTLQFRSLKRADIVPLAEWIAAPHVAPWWQYPKDVDEVRATYEPTITGTDPTEVFIVEQDDVAIAMMQRYRLNDYPEWKEAVAPGVVGAHLAGIDFLIGSESNLGRGLGGEMISQFVALTWARYPDVTSIVVAVNQRNRRSWRVLEKSGFSRSWAGTLASDDPSDREPSYIYVRQRA